MTNKIKSVEEVASNLHEMPEWAAAAELSEQELDFIDQHAEAAFADERCERPYVLVALCGSILSNIIRQSDGAMSAEDLMEWVRIATTSQVDHECCDGECNHDDCCGKIKENCPNFKTTEL